MRKQLTALLAAFGGLLVCVPALADPDSFSEMESVSAGELAEIRGGIRLELNGLDVRIAIGIETRVDDELLLRTELGAGDLLRSEGTSFQRDSDASSAPLETSNSAETLFQSAGDPLATQVFHVVGVNDFGALVQNRVDGVSIQTVGEMQVEVGNFSRHQLAADLERVGSVLSTRLEDASTTLGR